ncbi:MAG: hypothetical protein HGN29_09600 [Asgard group archaeon]|nr:hypothetical protein [Asgard group archaeon]
MFDLVKLPQDLCNFLVSISPLLGIGGSIENQDLYVLTKYFPLSECRVLIALTKNGVPKELSLNLLRKGEDRILISAYNKDQLGSKLLKNGNKISAPIYNHSVVSFEAKLIKHLDYNGDENLAIYEIVHAVGIAGLDPDFNDSVTIAKTLEVMSLTAVDTLVIEKKIQQKIW